MRSSHLRVPSADTCSATISGRASVCAAASLSSSGRAMLRMAAKSARRDDRSSARAARRACGARARGRRVRRARRRFRRGWRRRGSVWGRSSALLSAERPGSVYVKGEFCSLPSRSGFFERHEGVLGGIVVLEGLLWTDRAKADRGRRTGVRPSARFGSPLAPRRTIMSDATPVGRDGQPTFPI